MSSASTRSNIARNIPITPSNHVQVSANTPLHPIFPGDQAQPEQAVNRVNDVDPLLERLITESGHGSYIADFNHLGIRSIPELIRFALESIPPSLGVTPVPSRDHFPLSNHAQSAFAALSGSSSEQSHSERATSSAKRRTQKKLYEVAGTISLVITN